MIKDAKNFFKFFIAIWLSSLEAPLLDYQRDIFINYLGTAGHETWSHLFPSPSMSTPTLVTFSPKKKKKKKKIMQVQFVLFI